MTRKRQITTSKIKRFRNGCVVEWADHIAVEEPLQIVVDDEPYAVTLRTPGDDKALAAGWCLTEGVIECADDLAGLWQCEEMGCNDVFVALKKPVDIPRKFAEGRESRSSCSLCGRRLVEDAVTKFTPVTKLGVITPDWLDGIRRSMEDRQKLFGPTGSTHAAALFNLDGELLSMGEDVGRHNALDKAIGRALLDGRLDLAAVAFVSSRASFEMVQKAARAGLMALACTSGPTSMAVDLAREAGLGLAAFVRPERFTIYAGFERFDFSGVEIEEDSDAGRDLKVVSSKK